MVLFGEIFGTACALTLMMVYVYKVMLLVEDPERVYANKIQAMQEIINLQQDKMKEFAKVIWDKQLMIDALACIGNTIPDYCRPDEKLHEEWRDWDKSWY